MRKRIHTRIYSPHNNANIYSVYIYLSMRWCSSQREMEEKRNEIKGRGDEKKTSKTLQQKNSELARLAWAAEIFILLFWELVLASV